MGLSALFALGHLVGALLFQEAARGWDETWSALNDGPARTRAAVAALEPSASAPDRDQVLVIWEYGLRCATEYLWLDDAIAVQEALHASQHEPWSALNLANSLHRAGHTERADQVLAEQEQTCLARGQSGPLPELWNNRGIFALGRGEQRLARDLLGRATARGFGDSALILARLDLFSNRIPEARAGFRALLLDDEPHAWALRGWGLTLLPGSEPGLAKSSAAPYATREGP